MGEVILRMAGRVMANGEVERCLVLFLPAYRTMMGRHIAVASVGLGLLLSMSARGVEPSTQALSEGDSARVLTLSGGVDVVSSYYWRGYLQEDSGLILQPYVEVDAAVWKQESLSFTPFVRSWNSVHSKTDEESTNSNASNWYQSDLMVGGKVGVGDFQVMPYYTYTKVTDFGRRGQDAPDPDIINDSVQEAGVRLAYDDRALMQRLGSPITISPYILYARETSDDVLGHLPYLDESPWVEGMTIRSFSMLPTTTYQYVEVGLSPSFAIPDTPVTLIFPLALGMSPDGLYQNADEHPAYGDDAWQDTLIGYGSAGVTASTALPVPHRFGAWKLDVGVTYLALCADSARLQNNGVADYRVSDVGPSPGSLWYGANVSGEDHAWIGRIGLAFSY